MSDLIINGLKQTFDLASLRIEAKSLRTPIDWEKGREIHERYQGLRENQEKKYYDQYEARVERVMKNLIDRAGAVAKDFKHRLFSQDPFNRKMLTKQAHRLVQQDHQRRILQIDSSETKELDELIAQVKQRDALKDKSINEFARVANPRMTVAQPDHPQPSRHR